MTNGLLMRSQLSGDAPGNTPDDEEMDRSMVVFVASLSQCHLYLLENDKDSFGDWLCGGGRWTNMTIVVT